MAETHAYVSGSVTIELGTHGDVSLPTNQVEIEQEAINLPIGPITRARAKRFKDAISAMVERIEENNSKELRNELNIFNFLEAEFRPA
ncbi:hypothetical protein Goshw_024800, partial [Gossypium schwendimanii]|nr:hypothetical protein [Gossypium schwendimanii]